MRHFVRRQRVRTGPSALAEDDVASVSEGAGAKACREASSARTGVNPNVAQRNAEVTLHVGAQIAIERSAGA
jgi:hypothetical protein